MQVGKKVRKQMFPPRLFVTGTDTGVGKTLVSAVLLAGLEGAYWKPIQTGSVEGTDSQWIRAVTGLDKNRFLPEAYLFAPPVSPHLAARMEEKPISIDSINVPDVRADHLIIEGAGGVMVPLDEKFFMVDLIKKIGAPVIVVASSRLGTINHTLLTLEQLKRKGIEIFGVVMNGPPWPENSRAIEFYGRVKIVAEISPMKPVTLEKLKSCFKNFSP